MPGKGYIRGEAKWLEQGQREEKKNKKKSKKAKKQEKRHYMIQSQSVPSKALDDRRITTKRSILFSWETSHNDNFLLSIKVLFLFFLIVLIILVLIIFEVDLRQMFAQTVHRVVVNEIIVREARGTWAL